MARISWLIFMLAAPVLQSEAQKPLSGLNMDGFAEASAPKNPFARDPDDLDFKKPKLLMVVVGKNNSAALINSRVVREKDRLGSSEVISIRMGEVTLRSPGGIAHLRLEGSKVKLGDSGLYHVELKEAPLGDAIKLLAIMQNKNVVMPSKLEDPVTASFPQVSLAGSMQALLESRGFTSNEKNDVIQILTKKDQETLGGDLITHAFVLKYAKAKDIKEQAAQLASPRGTVMVDDRTNTLTVRDTANYIKTLETFMESIDNIDQQVLIEARVVEASTGFVQSFGIQWGVSVDATGFHMNGVPGTGGTSNTGNLGNTATPGGTTAAPGTTPKNISPSGGAYINATRAASPLAALALGIPFTSSELDIELSAAETNNNLTVLSKPSIITMNNQPATIHSGSKVYLQIPGALGLNTTGQLGSVNTLQNISAGITMVVTPQITVDGKIRLTIDVTSSQFNPSTINTPQIQIFDNNARTQILLSDGQTTVLGGLYQATNSNSKGGIPFLSRLPLIGALFRNSTDSKDKRELLVFISPKIVKINEPIKALDRSEKEAVSPL